MSLKLKYRYSRIEKIIWALGTIVCLTIWYQVGYHFYNEYKYINKQHIELRYTTGLMK